jgi:hypothetical protein
VAHDDEKAEANGMGLTERRMMQELKEKTLPEREKEIEEICGKVIPYDVDWESMADNSEALRFVDNLSCITRDLHGRHG